MHTCLLRKSVFLILFFIKFLQRYIYIYIQQYIITKLSNNLKALSHHTIREFNHIYEPVTKGCDLKWDTLPQNQTPDKLFSVLPLESGMFQATISIIKKLF